MTRADLLPILCALRDISIFIAFVAVLVTAPTWAAWLDGETDHWERAAADRHAEVYRRIYETHANGGME